MSCTYVWLGQGAPGARLRHLGRRSDDSLPFPSLDPYPFSSFWSVKTPSHRLSSRRTRVPYSGLCVHNVDNRLPFPDVRAGVSVWVKLWDRGKDTYAKRGGQENPTPADVNGNRVTSRPSTAIDQKRPGTREPYPFGGDRVRQKAAATTTIIAHRWHLTFLNFRRRLDRFNLPKFRRRRR